MQTDNLVVYTSYSLVTPKICSSHCENSSLVFLTVSHNWEHLCEFTEVKYTRERVLFVIVIGILIAYIKDQCVL